MAHAEDYSQRIVVRPALDARELELLQGLAGGRGVLRHVWPGQPGPRSPWSPCADGCCLAAADRATAADLARWLRFLIRELLAVRAAAPRARADEHDLPGAHHLEGRVLVDGPGPGARIVVVANNRVRLIELDDELFPVAPEPRRGPGEVIELETQRSARAQSTER